MAVGTWGTPRVRNAGHGVDPLSWTRERVNSTPHEDRHPTLPSPSSSDGSAQGNWAADCGPASQALRSGSGWSTRHWSGCRRESGSREPSHKGNPLQERPVQTSSAAGPSRKTHPEKIHELVGRTGTYNGLVRTLVTS